MSKENNSCLKPSQVSMVSTYTYLSSTVIRRVITSVESSLVYPSQDKAWMKLFRHTKKLKDIIILTINCCFFVSIARLNNNNNMNNFRRSTENEMKILSLPMIQSNSPSFRPIDYERFKAKFGVTVTVCTITWNMVVSKLNRYPHIRGYRFLSPHHLLYALFFLKCYPTARQAIGSLGQYIGLNSFRKYSYFMIRQVASLSNQVVRQNN